MDKVLLQDLLKKYRKGTASPDEVKLLENWYLFEAGKYPEAAYETDELDHTGEAIWKRISSNIETDEQDKPETIIYETKRSYKLWYRLSAAAAVLITLTAALLFYFKTNDKVKPAHITQYNTFEPIASVYIDPDIVPGGNRATLTLADGTKILLNNIKNGKLAEQAGMVISKTSDGLLEYKAKDAFLPLASSHKGNTVQTILPFYQNAFGYNTLTTPRGGQYQIILPDGTKVWLNAASSLKYPSSFASLKERKVELSGEAYFEVIKDHGRPFRVMSQGQQVEVLGTHFNIENYANEPAIRTTLLKGSVRVTALNTAGMQREIRVNNNIKHTALHAKQTEVILKPGQQSEVANFMVKLNPNVNLEQEMAWKNGEFRFNHLEFKAMMRIVSRWYDVDIYYQGKAPEISYGGSISRYTSFRTLLGMMEYIGYVRFKVDGRRIIVKRSGH